MDLEADYLLINRLKLVEIAENEGSLSTQVKFTVYETRKDVTSEYKVIFYYTFFDGVA